MTKYFFLAFSVYLGIIANAQNKDSKEQNADLSEHQRQSRNIVKPHYNSPKNSSSVRQSERCLYVIEGKIYSGNTKKIEALLNKSFTLVSKVVDSASSSGIKCIYFLKRKE